MMTTPVDPSEAGGRYGFPSEARLYAVRTLLSLAAIACLIAIAIHFEVADLLSPYHAEAPWLDLVGPVSGLGVTLTALWQRRRATSESFADWAEQSRQRFYDILLALSALLFIGVSLHSIISE
jgi:hypothetical protein